MISVDVLFFEFTPYFNKETFKTTLLEPEDDFIFFLENSSSSYVNVDLMPRRYGQVYSRRAKSTTDVLVVHVSLIIVTISCENAHIPSVSVDIDSESDLDIHIARYKGKMSCTLHPLHKFLSYAHLFTQYRVIFYIDLILFLSLFLMPCQIQVGGYQWKMKCMP